MDRLNQLHLKSRVDLSNSVDTDTAPKDELRVPFLRPVAAFYAGVFGFACVSAVVIATASIVALHIR